MYRVNYGNGQVSDTYETKVEAKREAMADQEWSRRHRQPSPRRRVQQHVNGDWVTVWLEAMVGV